MWTVIGYPTISMWTVIRSPARPHALEAALRIRPT
jgi:hypothetical protein